MWGCGEVDSLQHVVCKRLDVTKERQERGGELESMENVGGGNI